MTPAVQTLAVALAFLAAAVSLGAAGMQFFRDGSIRMTPIIGGLFMLSLGIGGYLKRKRTERTDEDQPCT